MKLLTFFALTLLLAASVCAQNANTPATTGQGINANTNANASAKKKRGPVFRANKDQIKQAQTILKQRTLYSGEATGKLDPDTRAALKKYQEAEGLKATGTLNAATLVKLGIQLTERQKEISKM